MKTLVINLPQSTDRLRSLNEQLNAHPYLDVEVIEAVDDADFLRKKQTERLTADDSAAIIIGTLGQVKSDAPCLIKRHTGELKKPESTR